MSDAFCDVYGVKYSNLALKKWVLIKFVILGHYINTQKFSFYPKLILCSLLSQDGLTTLYIFLINTRGG